MVEQNSGAIPSVYAGSNKRKKKIFQSKCSFAMEKL